MARSGESDVLSNHAFHVWINGFKRMGFQNVSGLKYTIEKMEYREGGDIIIPRKSPGLANSDDVTLARGIITDIDYHNWAQQVVDRVTAIARALTFAPSARTAAAQATMTHNFRRDISLSVYRHQMDKEVRRYDVYECWPNEYTAIPELNGMDQATVAVETLALANEGFSLEHHLSYSPMTA